MPEMEKKKGKFGRHATIGFIYGSLAGFLFYIIGAVATGAGAPVPATLPALGFALGFTAGLALELEKTLE